MLLISHSRRPQRSSLLYFYTAPADPPAAPSSDRPGHLTAVHFFLSALIFPSSGPEPFYPAPDLRSLPAGDDEGNHRPDISPLPLNALPEDLPVHPKMPVPVGYKPSFPHFFPQQLSHIYPRSPIIFSPPVVTGLPGS